MMLVVDDAVLVLLFAVFIVINVVKLLLITLIAVFKLSLLTNDSVLWTIPKIMHRNKFIFLNCNIIDLIHKVNLVMNVLFSSGHRKDV